MVLMTWFGDALFGWCRPHPESGVRPMHGLFAWTCTIFRNEGRRWKSSRLILAAEECVLSAYGVQKDGFVTYVWRDKVESANPGYCFKMAGWKKIGTSKDGKKDLLQKSIERIKLDHDVRDATPSPISA